MPAPECTALSASSSRSMRESEPGAASTWTSLTSTRRFRSSPRRPTCASSSATAWRRGAAKGSSEGPIPTRSEEHTSELQSLAYLVCRLLLEKKKKMTIALTSLDQQITYRSRTAAALVHFH